MRRQVYQTPKSYLSFLQLYKAMYKEKLNELKVMRDRERKPREKFVSVGVWV